MKDLKRLKNTVSTLEETMPVIFFMGLEAENISFDTIPATSCCLTLDDYDVFIEEVIKINDRWYTRDDYSDLMYEKLAEDERYFPLTTEEFSDIIDGKLNRTNFIKAVCIFL